MRRTTSRLTTRIAVALTIACCALPAAAPAAIVADLAPGLAADGPVRALATAGATTFVGGDFTRIGMPTGSGALLDRSGGRLMPGAASVTGGAVEAVVPDGTGGWYIGGDFTHVGGAARPRLAHLRADGTLDAGFAPRLPAGAVLALALGPSEADADVLYAGGTLGAPVIALDRSTGDAIRDWVPSVGNPQPTVVSLAAAPVIVTAGAARRPASVVAAATTASTGVTVVWGARAVSASGASRNGEAVASASLGGPARAVAFGAGEAAGEDTVLPVYYATGTAVAAAKLTVQPASSAAGIASDYADWSRPVLACPDSAPCVDALAVTRDRVYAGGAFTVPAEPARARLLALAPVADPGAGGTAAGAPPPVGAIPDGRVRGLAVSGDLLLLAGDFAALGAVPRERSGALRLADHTVAPWAPRLAGGAVRAVAGDGDRAYAGGSFTIGDAVERRGIAAIAGTSLLPFAPAIACGAPCAGPRVHALATDGTTLWAGGIFDHAGGAGRLHLAAFDAVTGDVRPGFRADARGPAPGVLALGLSGGTLFAGGGFDEIGGAARANLAALDPQTGAPRAWRADTDGSVYAVLARCGTVYAGGSFDGVGGAARERIAALDPASGSVLDWDPGASSAVHALARHGDTVYAGGTFTSLGGSLRSRLGAIDAWTGRATGWNPTVDGAVRAIVAGDGAVYVGGSFARVGDEERSRLAAVDPAGGAPLAWAPAADDAVRALAATSSGVAIGGDFATIGALPRRGLAAFAGDAHVPATPRCAGDEPPAAAPVPQQSAPVAAANASTATPRAIAVSTATRAARLVLRVRVRRRGRRATFTVELSAPARVGLALTRSARRRCGRRRCTRFVPAGRVTASARTGATRLTRRLRPGRYRVRATARSAGGQTARPVVISFRVRAARR